MTDSGTPGPWEARHSIAGCIDSVWDSNGHCLAHIVRAPGEMSVSDANARKMAAVPDMEAALEAAIQAHDELVQAFVTAGVVETYDQPEWVSEAKAALAKARGNDGD